MRFAHGETVTVLRRPARDKFGDTSYVAHHDIDNVAVDLRGSDEPNPSGAPTLDRPLATYDATAYMAVGSDVIASDIVELADGTQYHVVGRPERPRHPRTGNQPAVIVRLRRIEG